MLIVGIDPGQEGAVAGLRCDHRARVTALLLENMPLDAKGRVDPSALADLLRQWRRGESVVPLAWVERVGPRPQQGIASTWHFAQGYGAVLGVLASLTFKTFLVAPQTWQTRVMAPVMSVPLEDPKTRSVLVARTLFEGADLRRTARSKVAHHGRSDALLIAEYGRLQCATFPYGGLSESSHVNPLPG